MQDFDDDPRLAELLPSIEREALENTLSEVAGCSVHIVENPQGEAPYPVELNLEVIGWVSGPDSEPLKKACARIVETVCRYTLKYHMAANLHKGLTERNYDELCRQNAELKQSEARYKQLAGSLKEQVDRQVEVIQQTQHELYESARLRAVGHLAAGVAHEINNPIGFIKSNLQVANSYLSELGDLLPKDHSTEETLSDFKDLVTESLHGAQRIASIVSDLKSFSSIDEADYVVCAVEELLDMAIQLAMASNRSGVEVEKNFSTVPMTLAHRAKLCQGFYNIIENALQASAESGVDTIQVACFQDQDRGITIVVSDKGPGISPHQIDQVFDPFFTTRQVGAGTGLGLTVARDIVRAHGGDISLKSMSGTGTSVTIQMPVTEGN